MAKLGVLGYLANFWGILRAEGADFFLRGTSWVTRPTCAFFRSAPQGCTERAAPARLVVGALGCFVFEGVVVLVVL